MLNLDAFGKLSPLIINSDNRMMMGEVRVYDAEGKLKEIIEPKTLMKKLYESEGFVDNPIAKKTEFGSGICKECGDEFIKSHKNQIFCDKRAGNGRKLCYYSDHKRRSKRPIVDKICKKCEKTFKGVEGRVYCNDPCVSISKSTVVLPNTRDCDMCGRAFKPKKKINRFCGMPCTLELQEAETRRLNLLDKLKEDERNIKVLEGQSKLKKARGKVA